MLRMLWRLLLGSLALMLAIPLGCFVLGAGVIADPAVRGMMLDLIRAGLVAGFRDLIHTLSPDLVLDATAAVAKSLLLLVTVPPALAAVIGETLRFRALSWYAGASGLTTAALPWLARSGFRLPSGGGAREAAHTADVHATALLLCAGAASGFTYWLVAGWSAGGPHRLAESERPDTISHPPSCPKHHPVQVARPPTGS